MGEGLWKVFIQGEIRIIDAKQNVIYKFDARDPDCVRQTPRFPRESEVSILLKPAATSVRSDGTIQFQATLIGFTSPFVEWSVDSTDEGLASGCWVTGGVPPGFVQCPFGFMGHLRQTGRKTTIRSTATYFAPRVPGKYYASFEGWQMEGCNGIGILKKRAVAEVEVTP